jgi:DNA adenine methylase
MGYFGGKGGSGVYQTLINQIPKHDVYISAFAGQDSVLQRIRKARRAIAVDLDPAPLNWWSLQERDELELYQCDAVAWLRHEFRLDKFPKASDAISSDHSGCDAKSSDSTRFVFIDPPYLAETRTSAARYRHEFNSRKEHQRLLDTVLQIPAPVMLCSYPNELYNARLSDWRQMDYFSTVRSGARRLERCWMNYDTPKELHDYTFFGGDKREREKIRRRARNWSEGLARMSPHERRAVLQEIEKLDLSPTN